MEDQIQKDFEDWFAKTYPLGNLERNTEEVLRKMIAEQAWKASRESLVIELPQQSGANLDWNQAIRYCHQAIESAGLKVKP